MYYIYIYIQYTRFTTRELPQQSWLNRGSGSGALWFGPHFPMAGSQDPDPSDVDPVDPVLTKVEWPDTEEESSIQDLPPPVPCLATSLLIEAVGRSRQSPNSPCSSPRDEKKEVPWPTETMRFTFHIPDLSWYQMYKEKMSLHHPKDQGTEMLRGLRDRAAAGVSAQNRRRRWRRGPPAVPRIGSQEHLGLSI